MSMGRRHVESREFDEHNISLFFGLSYNPYLVVPRSLRESMGEQWQVAFTKLLDEMCATPAGRLFEEAHYLVQRTYPKVDAVIHEAELHNATHDDDDEVEVPEPMVIFDPFEDYRHPDRSIFRPSDKGPAVFESPPHPDTPSPNHGS